MITLILLILVIIVATYLYLDHAKNNYPPGPYGVPLLGYIPFLGKYPFKTLTNLRGKYGNVISIRFGLETVVLLNDLDAIKEALVKQSHNFSGRQKIFLHSLIFKKDIVLSEGSIWREQRQMSLRILRDFGFGRSILENKILFEVDQITNFLNENAGKPIDISSLFVLPILNIIWNITAGKRFDEIDEFLLCFKEFLRPCTSQSSFVFLNSMPFLRHVIPQIRKNYNDFYGMTRTIIKHLEQEVENHVTNFSENNLKDFIDVYLDEINKRKGPDGVEVPPYTKEHLVGTMMDFLFAGGETTDSTMNWALLHMVNSPEVQRKVQEELDRVIEKDSYIPLSSKSLCPYTEATIMEIQRHPTLTPTAIAHSTITDTTIFGFKIQKNTRILPNIYAVHHDERYWDSPDTFRPERFLNETGKNIIKHESFIPFSLGARTCMGESLAKLELHLIFTCLMRRFTFEPVPGEEIPTMEPIIGSVLKTKPYKLIIKPR